MKTQILVPKLGPQMEKGVLVAWHKKEGEAVKSGEVLFEIETDKVVSEVEAEQDGTLVEVLVSEGDEVSVGSVIASIES